MIVDSMTYDEILGQLRKDVKIVDYKFAEGEKRFKKLARDARNKERIYYPPIRVKSAFGFNYVIIFYNEGINVPSKRRLCRFFYVWYVQKHGVHAITLSLLENTQWHVTIYTPHFIDRYKERKLMDMSISKVDAFHTYLMNNLKTAAMKKQYPSEKYPNDYWVECNDGINLCNHLKGYTVEAKTFISWDMLKGDEKDFAVQGRQFLLDRGFEMTIPDEDFENYTKDDEV